MNQASIVSKISLPSENDRPEARGIDEWVAWLSKQKMPIFSHTARKIHESMENRQVGAPELSQIILQDPTLTARILKLSNSPYYNPAGVKIHTISRGIVILGYHTIREITLACSFIETFVSINTKPQVNHKIAHALHAAIQAKSLAILANDPCPEEVFIAALLKDLGQISFACFDKVLSPRIEALSREQEIPIKTAEKRILGFTLDELGSALSRSWNLKGLLDKEPHCGSSALNRMELVRFSHALANAMESDCLDEDLKRQLSKFARQIQKPVSSLLSTLRGNREKFTKMAIQFGARKTRISALEVIEVQPSSSKAQAEDEKNDETGLQLKILQDISNLLIGRIDLNLVFEMVMEGIHRAAGMERTLFLVFTPDRRAFKEKSKLGWPIADDPAPIRIQVSNQENLFTHTTRLPQASWFKPAEDKRIASLYTKDIIDRIGLYECFAARVAVDNKAIGLLYADRPRNTHRLTRQNFESFSLFARQANIALALSRSSCG